MFLFLLICRLGLGWGRKIHTRKKTWYCFARKWCHAACAVRGLGLSLIICMFTERKMNLSEPFNCSDSLPLYFGGSSPTVINNNRLDTILRHPKWNGTKLVNHLRCLSFYDTQAAQRTVDTFSSFSLTCCCSAPWPTLCRHFCMSTTILGTHRIRMLLLNIVLSSGYKLVKGCYSFFCFLLFGQIYWHAHHKFTAHRIPQNNSLQYVHRNMWFLSHVIRMVQGFFSKIPSPIQSVTLWL